MNASDTALSTRPADFTIFTPSCFQKFQLLNKKSPRSERSGKSLVLCLKLLSSLQAGHLDVILPSGQKLAFHGKKNGPYGLLKIDNSAFARKVMTGGHVAFCESYIQGDWNTPDLGGLFHLIALNIDHFQKILMGQALIRMFSRLSHMLRPNTKAGARKNIYAHYDIGNDFYEAWLDPSMTYSAALFNETDDLHTAQARKYDALLTRLDVEPGDHILEIGCGWGGFAEYAAQKYPNIKITGLTISEAQYNYARQRLKDKGLDERVDIRLTDYRDIEGQFDKIVSIEMFEAVGMAYWQEYFDLINSRLKDNGRAAFQIITIRDEDFDNYRTTPDFIQRYIFPGGMLPPWDKLQSYIRRAHLHLNQEPLGMGQDYARTLNIWNRSFQSAWPDLSAGFDAEFKRLWELYLGYCEGGFLAGTIDVKQFSLIK